MRLLKNQRMNATTEIDNTVKWSIMSILCIRHFSGLAPMPKLCKVFLMFDSILYPYWCLCLLCFSAVNYSYVMKILFYPLIFVISFIKSVLPWGLEWFVISSFKEANKSSHQGLISIFIVWGGYWRWCSEKLSYN